MHMSVVRYYWPNRSWRDVGVQSAALAASKRLSVDGRRLTLSCAALLMTGRSTTPANDVETALTIGPFYFIYTSLFTIMVAENKKSKRLNK